MTTTSETASCGSDESFYDRMPSVEFKPPTPDWGYLAQVNEKFKTVLTWDVERIVGEPAHRAMFLCTPGKSPASCCCMWGFSADPRLARVATNDFCPIKVCKYVLLAVWTFLIMSDRARNGEAP